MSYANEQCTNCEHVSEGGTRGVCPLCGARMKELERHSKMECFCDYCSIRHPPSGVVVRDEMAHKSSSLPEDAEILEQGVQYIKPRGFFAMITYRVSGQGGYDRAPEDTVFRWHATEEAAQNWLKAKIGRAHE